MLDTSNCRVSIVSLTDAFLIVFWVSWRNGSAIVSVERFSCKNLFTLPFWADFFILSLANKYLYSSAPHNILCTVFFTEPFLGRLLTPLLYFKEVGVQVRDDILWTILLFFDCLFTATLFLWKTFHTKHDTEYQEKDRQDQVLLSRVKFREEAYIMENIFIVGFFADI